MQAIYADGEIKHKDKEELFQAIHTSELVKDYPNNFQSR